MLIHNLLWKLKISVFVHTLSKIKAPYWYWWPHEEALKTILKKVVWVFQIPQISFTSFKKKCIMLASVHWMSYGVQPKMVQTKDRCLRLNPFDFFQFLDWHECEWIIFLFYFGNDPLNTPTLFIVLKKPNFSWYHKYFHTIIFKGVNNGQFIADSTVFGVPTC